MSRRQHLQAKSSKTSKKSGGNLPLLFLRWVGFAACLTLAWILLFQGRFSGRLGAPINAFFTDLLGAARFLLPVFLVHGLVLYLKDSKGVIARTLAALFSLGCIATVFAVIAEIVSLDPAVAGGAVGARAGGMFVDNIGKPGGLILGGALSALGLQLLFGIKWGQLASEVMKLVAADYKDWQKNRQELSITLAAAKAAEASAKPKPLARPDA